LTQTEKKRHVLRRRLENLTALASPILALMFLAYLQSKPNTSHVALTRLFNGERAFADLKRIVDFGPRPAGSKNLEHSRGWILDRLHRAGVETEQDSFVAATPLGSIPMTNIVAKIPGARPAIIILGGHYDTKRMATPFVGANDGGSSAAFLLEMARVLTQTNNKLTYWLVFFDGEEAIKSWPSIDGLYGSRHFTNRLLG
jgi:glutaminyl-peptide cyclotransferase